MISNDGFFTGFSRLWQLWSMFVQPTAILFALFFSCPVLCNLKFDRFRFLITFLVFFTFAMFLFSEWWQVHLYSAMLFQLLIHYDGQIVILVLVIPAVMVYVVWSSILKCNAFHPHLLRSQWTASRLNIEHLILFAVHQIGRQCQAGEHWHGFKSLFCSVSHSCRVDSRVFLGYYLARSQTNSRVWPFWWARLQRIGTASHWLYRSLKAIQVTPLLQDIPQNNCNPTVQSLDSATQVGACPAGNAAAAAAAAVAAAAAAAAAASARGNWLA